MFSENLCRFAGIFFFGSYHKSSYALPCFPVNPSSLLMIFCLTNRSTPQYIADKTLLSPHTKRTAQSSPSARYSTPRFFHLSANPPYKTVIVHPKVHLSPNALFCIFISGNMFNFILFFQSPKSVEMGFPIRRLNTCILYWITAMKHSVIPRIYSYMRNRLVG